MLSPRCSRPLWTREAAWRIASCATWLVPISNDQPALRSSKSIQLTYCYAKRNTDVKSDMTNLGIGITSTHVFVTQQSCAEHQSYYQLGLLGIDDSECCNFGDMTQFALQFVRGRNLQVLCIFHFRPCMAATAVARTRCYQESSCVCSRSSWILMVLS